MRVLSSHGHRIHLSKTWKNILYAGGLAAVAMTLPLARMMVSEAAGGGEAAAEDLQLQKRFPLQKQSNELQTAIHWTNDPVRIIERFTHPIPDQLLGRDHEARTLTRLPPHIEEVQSTLRKIRAILPQDLTIPTSYPIHTMTPLLSKFDELSFNIIHEQLAERIMIMGRYNMEKNIMVLNGRLSESVHWSRARMTIVHELTHFLQFQQGDPLLELPNFRDDQIPEISVPTLGTKGHTPTFYRLHNVLTTKFLSQMTADDRTAFFDIAPEINKTKLALHSLNETYDLARIADALDRQDFKTAHSTSDWNRQLMLFPELPPLQIISQPTDDLGSEAGLCFWEAHEPGP